jgi:erythromycin esterase
MTGAVLFFFSCQTGGDTSEQPELTEPQQRLVQELNGLKKPLGSLPLDLTDNDLSFLNPLQGAKIVGLGEATHGTRQFFQMKHRIFQYLVQYFRHKAFGFEADFAESLYFNDYVTQGQGNLEVLMETRMHFWTWATQEVKQLVQWMRQYNLGKDESEKIYYLGFDCQFTTFQTDLLREYLSVIHPGFWERIAPVMEEVRNLNLTDYEQMSQETFDSTKAELESLETAMEDKKIQLISASSQRDYMIHRHLLRTFRQAFVVLFHYYQTDNTINWRDRFMAENVLWMADLFGPETRITLWGHNYHISKGQAYGAMGRFLDNELDTLYQAVGFSFSQGRFNARSSNFTLTTFEITGIPQADSLNFIFHSASDMNFAVDLRTIPQGSDLAVWLNAARPFLSIEEVYDGNPEHYYENLLIPSHFDLLIYFDQSSESQLL